MIKVKAENVLIDGCFFDYELEDGTLLNAWSWKQGDYIVHTDDNQEAYFKAILGTEKDHRGQPKTIGFELTFRDLTAEEIEERKKSPYC
ncbi:MAG: hypothetical protein ACOX05_06850 [Bacillota bacterium]|jgi:hypothetical protein